MRPWSVVRPLTSVLVCLLVLAACQSTRTDAVSRGLATITGQALMADVTTLTQPAFAGRLAGDPGYEAAARWAARRFDRLKLRPAGDDGGYLQRLPIEHNAILGTPRLTVTVGGETEAAVLGRDFVCRGFTGSGTVTAPVVFAGYGLSAPARGYDDYADLDVAGKVVLVFKRNPQWSPDSVAWDWASSTPRAKARTAGDHGALAMLWFEVPHAEAQDGPDHGPIGSVLHGPGEHLPDLPQLEIDHALADRLLGGTGAGARLQARIDSTRVPASRPLDARAAIAVEASYDPARQTCNVVARLPGRDPLLKDEVLVIGAHLDHVGRQGPYLYFPGANDNASGAAAVLRLAEAFSSAQVRPRRSVVFVLFAGEESGLVGARYYVGHPTVAADHVTAMFNLDCVACGDSIRVGGGESDPAHWQLARDLDRAGARLMVADTWSGGGADATPFYEAGIPTLYWVTTNSYPHLHQPSDTPETLNRDLYTELVRLAFRTAWAVADAPADSTADAS
ncbi:MAG: M20/M25/M40 family metallo-hydrolase [Candidatus Krumholzibacteriia bacterium]